MDVEKYFNRGVLLLKKIRRMKAGEFKDKILALNKKQVKFLEACSLNILKGKIPVEGKDLLKAKLYKPFFRSLARRNLKTVEKKSIIANNQEFARFVTNLSLYHLTPEEDLEQKEEPAI